MRCYMSLVALLVVPLASAQLNELAKKAGKLYFGTATDNRKLSNPQYLAILSNTREFGQLVPENFQKWEYIEPQQNVFNFTPADVVTNLAKMNNQKLRCHNLCWHSQLPDWVSKGTWNKKNLTAALVNHVTKEAQHWGKQCYAWDVLNEALNENGTYRQSVFYDVLGEDYIRIAFAAAAKAVPHAKLYYNDYNIESPGPKATAALNIAKMLKAAGLKIDGMGLQSHFVAGGTPSIDAQISTMQSYAAIGLDVAQTELDVRIELPLTAENLAQQSKDYETSVGACMQVKKCVGVTVWEWYDPYSWVPEVFAGFGAADLYFDDFTRHPAYQGVVNALKNGTKQAVTAYPQPPTGTSKKTRRWYA